MLKTASRRDLDGVQDRQAIYALLESFDGERLAENDFQAQALDLIEVAGVTSPTDLHTWLAQYAAKRGQLRTLPLVHNERSTSADDAMTHRFTFYGETHQLTDDFDFEVNPGTGHWVHDLNRFSYLNPLVKAFAETRDRKYARKAIALILHWIEGTDVCRACPTGQSPAIWLSYLNIGIHSEIWAYTLLELLRLDPEVVAANELLTILKSIYDQIQYLDWVIPEKTNNWISIGTRCQLATMACLPVFRSRAELATRAWARLEANVLDTVTPDGVQTELTPGYHACVVRNVREAFVSEPYLDSPAPPGLKATYRKMLWYMRQTITPDGLLVAFNDTDPLSGRGILNFLKEQDIQDVMGDDATRPLSSACFPYGGVMIMRQGNERGTDELYMAFDGGPYGLSHQHEDKLSFWLSAYGRSLIVDPGRHLYDTTIKSYRPYLVTTAAHSTIEVDGYGQNSCPHRELWVAKEPMPLTWVKGADGQVTAGASYTLGYGESAIPVHHKRTIRFVPEPGYWVVDDELTGDGAHDIVSHFQFAPGELTIGDHVVHTTFDDANLAVFFEPDRWCDVRVACGEEEPRAGWYSHGVNLIQPAPRLDFVANNRALPLQVRYVLVPYRGTTLPQRVMD